MKTKQCRMCLMDLPLDCYYVGTCGDGKSSWCKHCAKQRVQQVREFKKQLGYSARTSMGVVCGDNGYLERHTRRREREAELAERFITVQTEPENLNDPPPVWRDLTNCFLRPQTKVSSWKTA